MESSDNAGLIHNLNLIISFQAGGRSRFEDGVEGHGPSPMAVAVPVIQKIMNIFGDLLL